MNFDAPCKSRSPADVFGRQVPPAEPNGHVALEGIQLHVLLLALSGNFVPLGKTGD